MFTPKNFIRSRLARSLRGSRSSTKPPPPPAEPPARLFPDQSIPGSKLLSTVVEEDPAALDDWVDDFETVSVADIPAEGNAGQPAPPQLHPIETPAALPEPLTSAPSQLSDPFATPVNSLHPSSFLSRAPSVQRSVDKASVFPVRLRSASRASKKSSSQSSSTSAGSKDLKIIADFPLPPSFIPSPTDAAPVAPVSDDSSIFYDRDPFRVGAGEEQGPVEEQLRLVKVDSNVAESNASFYTALSRSGSPVHSLPPPPPPLFPPRAHTPSTTSHSINTITKATASLRRFGSLTKETLRTSFRTPLADISGTKARRKQRASHGSTEHDAQSFVPPPADLEFLPEFVPEAFDISFPAFDTAATSPRTLRPPRAKPPRSVQSFYGSLEDFLTSHKHVDEAPISPRSRFKSAPSLLLNSKAAPSKPGTQPTSPTLRPPPPTRPLPPLPKEPHPPALPTIRYQLVDPLELTASPPVSPTHEQNPRSSFSPPSPSWFAQNVDELGRSIFQHFAPSPASAYSQVSAESDSTLHLESEISSASRTVRPDIPSSPAPLFIPSPLPLPLSPSEVLHLRGHVNITDATSSRETFTTLNSFTEDQSEPTVVVRKRHTSRHSSSTSASASTSRKANTSPSHPTFPSRPRSRTSSVTRATITHYRRSIVETRKNSRTRSGTRKEKPSVQPAKPHLFYLQTSTTTATSATAVSLLPPLDIVSVASSGLDPTSSSPAPTPVLPIRPRPFPPTQRPQHRTRRAHPQQSL
ncbi:hypothetical protein BV25DRAFT_1820416 [Artomyces pyxidatus]|uniref:Uncharacterized protein n=1 Tax=Artomyces pyxidatus TaxID=48021 RepID=A0ACB8TDG6_9AGAM|nr:hypothetical protein BV25DRAFT_1820416 [Artomyces pyxidatus]